MEEGKFLELLSLLLLLQLVEEEELGAAVGGTGTWSSKRYVTIANKHK